MASKTFKASHLELRHKTYFAVLYVPKDVRHVIRKTKLSRSTETGDIRIAERRAHAYVLAWKSLISQARHNADDPVIAEALELLNHVKDGAKSELVHDVIDQRVDEISLTAPALAQEFRRIATGNREVLSALIPDWIAGEAEKGLKQKTIDQMRKDVTEMVKTFQTASNLTSEYTTLWVETYGLDNDLSASSVTRIVGYCRNFFRYLQSIGEADKNTLNPFTVPDKFKKSEKPNAAAKNKTEHWKAFSRNEIVLLYKKALEIDDVALANLIKIAAYTGARIEELCSLKCDAISLPESYFDIRDAKTGAGIRFVPIHTKVKGLMKTLIAESDDGYLLSGLTFNKYDDRSNAIGKRFGRLKKKMGFSHLHVFHSIRKTFVTTLENAGVPESTTADIVGHDKKKSITYGLYSGGTSLDVRKEAIKKVSYSFD